MQTKVYIIVSQIRITVIKQWTILMINTTYILCTHLQKYVIFLLPQKGLVHHHRQPASFEAEVNLSIEPAFLDSKIMNQTITIKKSLVHNTSI